MVFGRSEALEIRTIFQEALYDVINRVTHKKGVWTVEIIVETRAENTTVSVGELIPSNIIHYVRKSTWYKDQKTLWYNIWVFRLDTMNYRLNNSISIILLYATIIFCDENWCQCIYLDYVLYYVICQEIRHSFCLCWLIVLCYAICISLSNFLILRLPPCSCKEICLHVVCLFECLLQCNLKPYVMYFVFKTLRYHLLLQC